MKKVIAMMLALTMLFILSSCNVKSTSQDDETSNEVKSTETGNPVDNAENDTSNNYVSDDMNPEIQLPDESGNEEENGENSGALDESNSSSDSSNSQTIKTYNTNETWTVPGVWKITFKGAAIHYFCNMYDKGENAANCITFVYDVENIGSEKIYLNFTVYDEEGEKAERYPCVHDDVGTVALDAGGKQTGIETSYAIKNTSSYVTVNISKSVKLNGKYEDLEAKFKVKVYAQAGEDSGNTTPLPKDVVYYTEHPEVPDFGAMLGIQPNAIERKGGVVGYAYDAASKDPNGTAVRDYVALLEKCGYAYNGGWYTDDGTPVVSYYNKTYGWRVDITTTTYNLLVMISKN